MAISDLGKPHHKSSNITRVIFIKLNRDLIKNVGVMGLGHCLRQAGCILTILEFLCYAEEIFARCDSIGMMIDDNYKMN